MSTDILKDTNRAMQRDYAFLKALIERSTLTWVVAQTNPNCEERAALSLSTAGTVSYLPMMPYTRKVPRAKRRIDNSRPMFVRYVFVGLDPRDGITTSHLRGCDGVETFLASRRDIEPHVVCVKEMMNIVDAAHDAQLKNENILGKHFAIGDNVMLVAGAFGTVKGTVRDIRGGGKSVRVDLKDTGSVKSAVVPIDSLALA
ncbi:transcription termination/antitermination NusG family protein [Flexibacterium corallicola]|uniref:transcription termination/antitermination NusG family protein n=1 Tax=Flexibacterium corallicola TaxID=3037259 RepID=UPI00286F13D9|nr:transcription termination/antitermination NusG family protein [Pseudovibrio sp. M1P-2-3]